MNKHVLTFSQIINESIGVGSVLLIKGKPSSDGRYLYATTIKGSIEIKPGIKMVFIGDEIYRVINKEGRFFGRKISYGSEEGLKGIFNMKNPGRPSIVLNHNKTPFHWITLKFNDIGSALREIGPRLFSHELILESDIDAQDNNQERQKELYDTICLEILKAISGQESKVSPKSIVLEDEAWEDDLGEIEDGYDTFEWYANMEIYLDPNKFREYERELADLELGGDFMDMLDVQNNIEVSILFESDVSVRHIHERGDYYEPDYYETELESADTGIMSIVIDDIYGNEIIATQTPEIKKLALDLEYLYSDHDMVPSDIKEDMEFMIMKSNGTHLNLDGKKKQRFNLKEATKKRSLALRDAGRALNPVGKRVKDPRLDQLAEEIREYWKKETGASEISNRDLLRIERDKINLEYYRSMSTDYSQTMFKSRMETIQKRLKEEIDRISK